MTSLKHLTPRRTITQIICFFLGRYHHSIFDSYTLSFSSLDISSPLLHYSPYRRQITSWGRSNPCHTWKTKVSVLFHLACWDPSQRNTRRILSWVWIYIYIYIYIYTLSFHSSLILSWTLYWDVSVTPTDILHPRNLSWPSTGRDMAKLIQVQHHHYQLMIFTSAVRRQGHQLSVLLYSSRYPKPLFLHLFIRLLTRSSFSFLFSSS